VSPESPTSSPSPLASWTSHPSPRLAHTMPLESSFTTILTPVHSHLCHAHIALRPTQSSGTHWVISSSCVPHWASLSPLFLSSGKHPLHFVEYSMCFPVHLDLSCDSCSCMGLGSPFPLSLDIVDSFPLMSICRYSLPIRLIVSEQ
jgi:hypothetical protein